MLESHRGCGRNDFPIRPMWNSFVAGVVFTHNSVASLRRELRRNGQLRDVCGDEGFRERDACGAQDIGGSGCEASWIA